MAVLRSTDLIKRGVEVLDEAKDSLSLLDAAERVQANIDMAVAYARLAEALGEKGIAEPRRPVGW